MRGDLLEILLDKIYRQLFITEMGLETISDSKSSRVVQGRSLGTRKSSGKNAQSYIPSRIATTLLE